MEARMSTGWKPTQRSPPRRAPIRQWCFWSRRSSYCRGNGSWPALAFRSSSWCFGSTRCSPHFCLEKRLHPPNNQLLPTVVTTRVAFIRSSTPLAEKRENQRSAAANSRNKGSTNKKINSLLRAPKAAHQWLSRHARSESSRFNTPSTSSECQHIKWRHFDADENS